MLDVGRFLGLLDVGRVLGLLDVGRFLGLSDVGRFFGLLVYLAGFGQNMRFVQGMEGEWIGGKVFV